MNSDLRSILTEDCINSKSGAVYDFSDLNKLKKVYVYKNSITKFYSFKRILIPYYLFNEEKDVQKAIFSLIEKAGNENIIVNNVCRFCGYFCRQKCDKYQKNYFDIICGLFDYCLSLLDLYCYKIIMSPKNKLYNDLLNDSESSFDSVDFRLKLKSGCGPDVYLTDYCDPKMVYGMSYPEYTGILSTCSRLQPWQHKQNVQNNIKDNYTTCGIAVTSNIFGFKCEDSL